MSPGNEANSSANIDALNSQQQTVAVPWYEQPVRASYRRRQIWDKVLKALILVAVLLVLGPLIDMLYLFAYKGLSVFTLSDITETTSAGAVLGGGGILNAITGTLSPPRFVGGYRRPVGNLLRCLHG